MTKLGINNNKKGNKDKLVDDLKKLTFLDFITVLWKIRLRFIGTSVSLFALGMFVANVGYSWATRNVAIEASRPFALDINLELLERFSEDETSKKLEEVYLVKLKDFRDENYTYWKIHKFVNAGGSYVIGTIKAPIVNRKFQFNFFDFIESVHAQPIEEFNWEGQENNTDFYEEYINENTIRRYYDNGKILEYRIDSQGKPVSGSFKWIR